MRIEVLKTKIHLATVTNSDLHYEGSIAIDENLCREAGLHPFERVDVYNCATGARFSTYVIIGQAGEISLNGAAARLVQKGDLVIIASYASIDEREIAEHKPVAIYVNKDNSVKEKKIASIYGTKTSQPFS